MKSVFNFVSLNGNYLSASLVYLGMAFMLLCIAPEISTHVRAGADTGPPYECSHTEMQYFEGEWIPIDVPGCPEGYIP
jgi:hypothetical protein